MNIKRQWLLSFVQIVLILLGGAMFLLSSGTIPRNLGWSFPWYFSVVLFCGVIVCFYFATKSSGEAEKQRALAHMVCRPALDEAEFGKRYFPPDRAEIAAKLREIFSRHIIVDLSQLQPNDRFVEDLRMDALDSMSTVEFVIEVEKEFGIKIPDAAAEKMTTFQSAVDYVAEAIKSKAI